MITQMNSLALTCLACLSTLLQGGGGNTPPANPEIAYLDRGIRVMNADGTNARLVIANVGSGSFLSDPGWSPDGQQLVFTGMFNAIHGIWRIDLDGTDRRLITPLVAGNGWRPRWSPTVAPDGQFKIVFTDSDGTSGNKDVFVVNLDGTERQNLTNTPSVYEYDAEWAGNGAQLVISRNHSVVRLDLVGSSGGVAIAGEAVLYVKSSVPLGTPPLGLSWAKTQPWLVFTESDSTAGGSQVLKILDVGGAPIAPYPVLAPNPSGDERWPSFSRDDARIAYHNGGIWVVNVDGTGRVRISKNGSQPSWRR